MGAHSQTGLVAVASCQEYLAGVIRKHELTRPDKEDDRVRHIEVLNAQTGPVFLTYRAVTPLDELFARKVTGDTPQIDFTAPDGVAHTSCVIDDATTIRTIEEEFARISFLYIADGHHRSAAAARVFQSRKGRGYSAHFLAVIFPHTQMQILPYNRVLNDLNNNSPQKMLKELEAVFNIHDVGLPRPTRKHESALSWR